MKNSIAGLKKLKRELKYVPAILMDEWVDGRMDGWVDTWMGGWMTDRWVGG